MSIIAFALGFSSVARAEKFDDFVIEGEVQKPEITVVISRENLNKSMDLAKLEKSFIGLVIDATTRSPF
jgi:hypothetical protein